MEPTGRTILVADDDRYLRESVGELLAADGHELRFAATAAETWDAVARERPDLVLLDIKFPDRNDLGLLERIKKEFPETQVIVISSQTEDVAKIVEAIKLGAYDFLDKPFGDAELKNRIAKALELQALRSSQRYLLDEAAADSGIEALVGGGEAMTRMRATLRKLAPALGPVLIGGESGTGKELAARALHLLSPRRDRPFVAVNCASIPEALAESFFFGHRKGAFTGAVENVQGRFEAAGDGTLFLDEIADLPPLQQGALLRVLESRTFTRVGETEERACRARFVFATNRDLPECVRAGTFREDLFYRINVAAIALPPLRARPEDLPELAQGFCARLGAEMGRRPVKVGDAALDLFRAYDWPGNVRELRNVIEGALMLLDEQAAEIAPADLPPELQAARAGGAAAARKLDEKERREREDLLAALKQCGGNQAKAARALGLHRNTVRNRIRYFGLGSAE